MTDTQRAAIEQLKQSEAVVVGPELIAQALGMNPSVLRQHVKDGDYKISAVEVCGSRIRFFRKDFLQKIGEMPEDEEKLPTDQLILKALTDLNEGVTMICQMLTLMMEPYQLGALNELINKKTASCGNS